MGSGGPKHKGLARAAAVVLFLVDRGELKHDAAHVETLASSPALFVVRVALVLSVKSTESLC